MLYKKDIICLSSIDWDFIWQGHQEIMAALVEQGNRVLFIDNMGVRPPSFRDLPRLKQRFLNWWRGTKGFREERTNLFVYSPLIIPFPYSSIARLINRRILLRNLRRWMSVVGFRRPIVWTFLPTPLALDIIDQLGSQMTIYYCIDDLSSSSSRARRILHSERRLLQSADLVFVTSVKLQQHAMRFRDKVYLFPFGVDFLRFERVRESKSGLPDDLRSVRRPVVGYVGGIHKWVNQELLVNVARQLPDVSFVFVGPSQSDTALLQSCPNVSLVGPRSRLEVPFYVKGFDVALVPYRIGQYTDCVYPTKLNEYLAMGVPVVATDIPEIRRFNSEHGELLAIAQDADGFAEAIREVLQRTSPLDQEPRIEAARKNSWETRIAQMSDLIEQASENRRVIGERWDQSLRRLYRAARRRIAWATVSVLAIYLLFFYSPFIWLVAEPLRVVVPPQRADAIVVFAGGVGESGKAGGGYQERVKHAVGLYQAGYSPRLIFSSGFVFAFKEAQVMRMLAISLGVPGDAILLEQSAGNTYENVAFVKKILERRGWRRILLVSSPFHMRRSLLTFWRVAPEIEVVPAPAASSQFYAHGAWATLEQIRGILQEYAAIGYYWWKGWI